MEGNIVYDEAAAQAVQDVIETVEKTFEIAREAIETAQKVLGSTPEAGGNLGTDSGKTIFESIRLAFQGFQEVLAGITKMRNAWQQIMEILGNAVSGSSSVVRNWVWSTVETVGSMSDEETGELIINTAGLIGKVGQIFTEDPLLDTVFGNMDDSARALVSGTSVQDNILDSYSSRLSSGEIGAGEYLAGGLTAGVTNAVISVVDATANLIGIDIPDEWNQGLSNAAGWLGEKAYQVVSGTIQSGFHRIGLAA